MKVTPDDYGRRCQFDHFCKLVLYHEAVDYFRERKRQRGWETSFETLPLSKLDTLCTIDQYPSDSFMHFSYSLYFISVCFVVECGKGRLMLLNVTFCGHSDVSQRGNVRQDQGGPRYSPEYTLHACKVDLTRTK